MKDLAEIVLGSLADICRAQKLFRGPVEREHSLVDDLGFDSLLFVDLIVLLEERTGLTDLPLLDWADREALRKTNRYTVQSLIEALERHAPRAGQGTVMYP